MTREFNQHSLVKPIVATLVSDAGLIDEVIDSLCMRFGPCDFHGDWHEFDHSTYYEPEMGKNLKRCMLAFETLCPGWDAGKFKGWTAAIEERFKVNGRRKVNLDPGYVDNLKVALVSGKVGGHKVSIAPGIWVDYLLWYNKGWVAFPWAFPDFRNGAYFKDFTEIRRVFKRQLKSASNR